MKLAYKNTEYKLKISLTKNKIGLLNDDVWCNVELTLNNNEFNYHINRESLSKKELNNIVNTLKKGYLENKKPHKLFFIKNYFTIRCYFVNTDKYMALNLIKPENTTFKNYKIIFKNNEILDFLHLIEQTFVN